MKIKDKNIIKTMLNSVSDTIKIDESKKVILITITYQKEPSMTIKDLALMLANLTKQIVIMNDKIDENSKQIKNLDFKISKRLDSIESRLDSLETRMDSLERKVQQAHPEIF